MDTEAHLRELAELMTAYEEYLTEAEAARVILANAIREAAEEEVRQVDICRATGYTREQVRRIVSGEDPVIKHMRRPRPPWQEAS